MDFYDVIRTRRSIRSYAPNPIPEDVLNKVLEAARLAPSGHNRQPWHLVVVRDEEIKKRLMPACGNQKHVAEAPIVIVACGRKLKFNRGAYMGEMSFLMDVSIAFTHLILAARAEGLGTCWIGNFNNEQVKEVLKIPQDLNVVAITPLGYPKDVGFAEPGPRKTLQEITSVDKF